MSLDRELAFETEICEYLASHGWLYVEGDAQRYDRARALFPADVLDFVQTTQPKEWAALTKSHGAKAAEVLLARLRAQLDQRGTLSVLRQGIDLLGLKQTLKLAEFRPALGINPDILARYAQNRLRVVRQVRYSLHNQNSIDLVLFLNGLPMATVELKTDFKQSVRDAIDQYRFDREPKPKAQRPARRAAAELSRWRAGSLCGERQRGLHDHQVGRRSDELSAVQPGRPRWRRQSHKSKRTPNRVSVAAGLRTRELARDPGPLPKSKAGR
jgi:hypothetical protein